MRTCFGASRTSHFPNCHPERSATTLSFSSQLSGAKSKDPESVSPHDKAARHFLENSLSRPWYWKRHRGPSTRPHAG
jgi:hypothetical protein